LSKNVKNNDDKLSKNVKNNDDKLSKNVKKNDVKVEQKDKKYNCNFCDTSCSSKSNLNTHVKYYCRSIFPKEEKTTICKNCNVNYSSISNLNKHLKKCNIRYNKISNEIENNSLNELNSINLENIDNVENDVENDQSINIQLVPFGFPLYDVVAKLSSDEIKNIISSLYPIVESVKVIHCNPKLPEYQNIACTDIKNSAYKYYNKDGTWKKEDGAYCEFIKNLLTFHTILIEEYKTTYIKNEFGDIMSDDEKKIDIINKYEKICENLNKSLSVYLFDNIKDRIITQNIKYIKDLIKE